MLQGKISTKDLIDQSDEVEYEEKAVASKTPLDVNPNLTKQKTIGASSGKQTTTFE